MDKPERLQKVLARAGIASRRHAEELIAQGHVRVNGKLVTEMGMRVIAHKDRVEVDGKRIVAEPIVYYIFHKPRGVVTTLNDPEGRPTIAEHLKDMPARVYPVGRLDFHTSGALMLTNDGALAQALLHPKKAVPKVYVCKVRGVPSDAALEQWRAGVMLPPSMSDPDEPRVPTAPCLVEILRHSPSMVDDEQSLGSTWLQVTLFEGRTRQIHRMAESLGLYVMRLARISFAGITTEGLRPGKLRPLTDKEVTSLRAGYLRLLEQEAEAKAESDAAEAVALERGAVPISRGEAKAPAPEAATGRPKMKGGAKGRVRTERKPGARVPAGRSAGRK